MFIDYIENIEKMLPYINTDTSIGRALRYLKDADMAALPVGKHVINGDDIFVNINSYLTKPKHDARPEAHVKYIDIQYIIEGEEEIGCSRLHPSLVVAEDNLAEKDLIFYRDDLNIQDENYVLLKQGMIAVFFPWDVHRPGCMRKSQSEVRKAIIKVKIV